MDADPGTGRRPRSRTWSDSRATPWPTYPGRSRATATSPCPASWPAPEPSLEAAEIRADLPNTTDEVASDLRELFAWTVREGVTNVIRHSHARSCRVALTPTSVEVTDDGRGPGDEATGSGLRGLRERAAAAGATVVTRSLSPRLLALGRKRA